MASIYILMGVSGSGKTTIGRALALRLRCPYYDGDEFHPIENIDKMSRGIPLDDADRAPWLAGMARMIRQHVEGDTSAVLGCSVLKKGYRQQLNLSPRVKFIFLDGSFELIWGRMKTRQGHFMKASMLRSQFAILERPAPDEAIRIDIDQSVDEIVREILVAIDTSPTSPRYNF